MVRSRKIHQAHGYAMAEWESHSGIPPRFAHRPPRATFTTCNSQINALSCVTFQLSHCAPTKPSGGSSAFTALCCSVEVLAWLCHRATVPSEWWLLFRVTKTKLRNMRLSRLRLCFYNPLTISQYWFAFLAGTYQRPLISVRNRLPA